ncbi:hypothetical protein C1H46_026254 [Malus baccata]|uniref:Uncharacterized protein n=1 Tax=Malus baccata TaxID=106549 RepID=A0A540LP01_MALBA|nr:hypothetical protein C1H46_026254 [Malus baccata]
MLLGVSPQLVAACYGNARSCSRNTVSVARKLVRGSEVRPFDSALEMGLWEYGEGKLRIQQWFQLGNDELGVQRLQANL